MRLIRQGGAGLSSALKALRDVNSGAKIVLSKLEEAAKNRGAGQIELNARETAVQFYEKAGYQVTESAHTLFGVIKHFKMRKNVGSTSVSGF
jgi:predicted GNAT family N-acyltransferase